MTSADVRPAGRLRPAGWAVVALGAAALAGVAAGTGTTPPTTLLVTATRAAADVVGVACVGVALVGLLLPAAEARTRRERASVRRSGHRALVVLGGAWAALVLVGATLRAADAFGRPVSALAVDDLRRWSVELAAGRGLLLAAACALAVAGCAAVALHDPDRLAPSVPLVVALLGLVTPAVTGHAGTAPDHQLAVLTAGMHAGAAGLWVGGLAVLLVVLTRHAALLAGALPRFSRIAGWCVVVIAVTGAGAAVLRLPSWGALLTTGYGQLVVTKAVLFAVLAGLGGLARRRLAAGRRPVLRWAGTEVALMAAALGVAAALTQSAP